MKKNRIQLLCRILKTDIVYESSDGMLTAFFDILSQSPLIQSDSLRRILREGCEMQEAPFVHLDEHNCYFAAIKTSEGFLYMGPMCHQELKGRALSLMYNSYGIKENRYNPLPVFTLPQIRDMVNLTGLTVNEGSAEDEELIQISHIIADDETRIKQEQVNFILHEEEENDYAAYRHSFREEQMLMQAIREGRPEDAVRLAENMDHDSGRLSKNYMHHRKNLAIIGIALCSRAAIDGGLPPESAYQISGYYIEKCDATENAANMLLYRNKAIMELAGYIRNQHESPSASNYSERCKDYIRKHYREKIYLQDIADSLGLSPTYLSRRFSKDTGECVQDYINRIRVYHASNLLLYSDRTLSEIAFYVGFPNQSYFGKIFKKFKNMSPKAYQDRYRSSEYTAKE